MKFGFRSFGLFALSAFAVAGMQASAQAMYTATQAQNLSAWGGVTGTFVNLPSSNSGSGGAIPVVTNGSSSSSLFSGGRNLGISAGVDLRVWQFHGFLPTVEVRGTYPVNSGSVAGEENVLGGIKIEHIFGRYHPYGDFLFGRGEMKYQGKGYVSPSGQYLYLQSFSNVLSFGGGADIDVTHHFAAKLDVQLWHQSVPVTASGTLNSLAVTAGVVYRFDFNKRPQVPKAPRSTPASAPRSAKAPAAPAPSSDTVPPVSTSP